MESDSSSCEDRLQQLQEVDRIRKKSISRHEQHQAERDATFQDKYSLPQASCQLATASRTSRSSSVKIIEKSLSSQVMEYYHKYSQSSNLDRYLSLPVASVEGYEYRWRSREQTVPTWEHGKTSVDNETKSILNEVPRERRKWVRPPLIGQQSGASGPAVAPSYSRVSSPEAPDKSTVNGDAEVRLDGDQRNKNKRPDNLGVESVERDTKTISPSSSVNSHKPLEWDSGADVGYHNAQPRNDVKSPNMLCGLERMTFARGICSTIQRTDPEGTTGSTVDSMGGSSKFKSPARQLSRPKANSTRLADDGSESEGEIQITPIVKANLPGIIAGKVVGSDEITLTSQFSRMNMASDTPKSSQVKKRPDESKDMNSENSLKKSTSMQVLALPLPRRSLKRSQSELNLRGMNVDFVSTSSIATIVNKPTTCDRNIQTNMIEEITEKESKAVQVSPVLEISSAVVNEIEKSSSTSSNQSSDMTKSNNDTSDSAKTPEEEEEKPVLPKRVSSLAEKPQSILKQTIKSSRATGIVKRKLLASQSSESQADTEGGRASNSFEYFPGDIYENVSQAHGGSTSHVSSVNTTGRSHSTMPNTSSSLDEKLWGDSDSLLRDLERSLNVLKSLVDANKCDKQVKKRLIHHVIKRLVTAKYTDDKIEHNLEENVPWNPDDTRNKVYRTEIIQALANKQKHTQSSEESSEDWKPRKKIIAGTSKRTQDNARELKNMIDLVSSENSDIFESRNTDRTDAMQDGRKARMGVRNDERHRHHQLNYRHPKDNLLDTDDKSVSSECFLPQSQRKTVQTTKANTASPEKSTLTTNSSREISECQITERRRRNDKTDWRLPTTMSERQFEYERCNSGLGTASRLIDYVEMEKKNQLVWINTEINHLSNLKKLLEQSKKIEKSETKSTRTIADRQPRILNGNSADRRTLDDRQWSSHGNLAERCDKSTCNIRKKKNSCTQTAVNGNIGYSKSDTTEVATGIDGSMRNNNSSREVSNAYSQTLTPQSSRDSSPWSPRRYCLQHANKMSNCQCRRPSVTSADDRRPVVSQSTVNSKKEAKNRLNDKCRGGFQITDYQEDYCVGKRHCRGCSCGSSAAKDTSRCTKSTTRSVLSPTRKDNKRCGAVRNDRIDDVRSCRVCGVSYINGNVKCPCTQTYMKPIAYELSFEEKRKETPKSAQSKKTQSTSKTTMTVPTSPESCKTENCSCAPTQPLLKDYLVKNKPEFVDNLETRKRYMSEISQLRQLKKEKRMQLLAMAKPSSLVTTPRTPRRPAKIQRKISEEEMKMRLRLRYLRLNEVRSKRRQQEKEEQSRKNHLMAKIFCKKLQQKVLNGQVDLSQSVSVISNL